MLFNSASFIFVFVPATVGATWLALRFGGRTTAVLVLIAASVVFYASWRLWAVGILAVSTLANIAIGFAMLKSQGQVLRRSLAAIGMVGNLGTLAYFKYANFFLDDLRLLGIDLGVVSVVLPLGISFFTFQKIAFLADIYERRIEEIRPLEFVLMVCFFPQLIAGPIVHYRDVVPQFLQSLKVNWQTLSFGLSLFSLGLAKKVLIADALSRYVAVRFDAAATAPVEFFSAWVGAFAYTFQIYFDFSGYTDMAIGLGLMFGIVLPINFLSPYKSRSIIEFWRTWHMTLSAFLRQYVYFPLGGNRRGTLSRYGNLLIVMLVGGLWHGAAWTFVAWGGVHGLFLVVNHLWRAAGLALPAVLAWPLTFLSVVLAWVIFRAADLPTALNMLGGMIGANGFIPPYGLDNVARLAANLLGHDLVSGLVSPMPPPEFVSSVAVIGLAALVALAMPNSMQIAGLVDRPSSPPGRLLQRVLASPVFAGLALWAGLQGVLGGVPSAFLYFQF